MPGLFQLLAGQVAHAVALQQQKQSLMFPDAPAVSPRSKIDLPSLTMRSDVSVTFMDPMRVLERGPKSFER